MIKYLQVLIYLLPLWSDYHSYVTFTSSGKTDYFIIINKINY